MRARMPGYRTCLRRISETWRLTWETIIFFPASGLRPPESQTSPRAFGLAWSAVVASWSSLIFNKAHLWRSQNEHQFSNSYPTSRSDLVLCLHCRTSPGSTKWRSDPAEQRQIPRLLPAHRAVGIRGCVLRLQLQYSGHAQGGPRTHFRCATQLDQPEPGRAVSGKETHHGQPRRIPARSRLRTHSGYRECERAVGTPRLPEHRSGL